MNCIIVDDEKHARENLIWTLNHYVNRINILGEASSVDEAYQLINASNPDVVFLDISMPEKDGFQLLEMFDRIPFEIVFVTAYEKYAIKAFEYMASAYILKPINEDLLFKVLDKLDLNRTDDHRKLEYSNLLKYLKSSETRKKLSIPIETGLKMIDMESIVFFEADKGYTLIHLIDGEKILSSKRLAYFVQLIPESNFIRIHQSYIVCSNYIESYRKNGVLTLETGQELPISRSYKNIVVNRLKFGYS